MVPPQENINFTLATEWFDAPKSYLVRGRLKYAYMV